MFTIFYICPKIFTTKIKIYSKSNRLISLKAAESSPLLKHGTFDRAEMFSSSTRNTVGCLGVFILKTLYRWVLQEKHYSKKQAFFGCSSYFDFFVRRERDRKKRHPKLSLVFVKKNSAQTNVSSRRKEGGVFWTLWSSYLPKGSIRKFWVYDNFYSTHRDLFTRDRKRTDISKTESNRARTDFLKTQPNRTKTVWLDSSQSEPTFRKLSRTEPELTFWKLNQAQTEWLRFDSICGGSEFWNVILYTQPSTLISFEQVISWTVIKINVCQLLKY